MPAPQLIVTISHSKPLLIFQAKEQWPSFAKNEMNISSQFLIFQGDNKTEIDNKDTWIFLLVLSSSYCEDRIRKLWNQVSDEELKGAFLYSSLASSSLDHQDPANEVLTFFSKFLPKHQLR
jgi:hypothetical protein